MNLEIIITTVLAIVTATLPLVQKKIINKTNIPNLHLILLALLAGLITAFIGLLFSNSWLDGYFISCGDLLYCLRIY